jgi:hypothetical protein
MRELILNSIDENELRTLIREVLTESILSKNQHQESKTDSIYLNRFEVIKLLKISLPTLNNWSKAGIVQSYRIGNRILYKLDEIEQAIQRVKNLKYKRG